MNLTSFHITFYGFSGFLVIALHCKINLFLVLLLLLWLFFVFIWVAYFIVPFKCQYLVNIKQKIFLILIVKLLLFGNCLLLFYCYTYIIGCTSSIACFGFYNFVFLFMGCFYCNLFHFILFSFSQFFLLLVFFFLYFWSMIF